ncbi:MAG TPA: Na+/H+ antiporter subunit E [Methanocorpusculum sp.]|nr:Na+/H+ antiporter subunit E [Methanocorpusculum sp.]
MSHFASGALAALAAFIVYLLLSAGSATETSVILCWSLPELIIGLLLALLVGFLCRKFVPTSAARLLNPVRWIQLIVYFIPFLFELTIANLKVSWSIISGRNVNPAIRKVESPMKTGAGLLLLSTSCTYQPGTVVVDADEKDNSIYVHFLDGGNKPKKTVEEKKLFSIINLVAWIRRICE